MYIVTFTAKKHGSDSHFSGAGDATVGIPFQTMLMRHLLLLIDYGSDGICTYI